MKKSNFIYLSIILILVGVILFLNTCGGEKVYIGSDTLTTQNNQAVKSIVKIDSSLFHVYKRSQQDSITRMNNYNNLLKRYYKAIKQAPDTCRSYIDTIYGDALIIDLTDSIAILRKDTAISLLADKINEYKKAAHRDTIRMGQLSDSLKTEQNSKKNFWKGVKVGSTLTAAIIGGVYVGSKIKP